MFLGENRHAVDDKGRVILPSQYRDELQGGAVLTKEVDGCIAVWPLEDFKARAQEMAQMRRTGEQRTRAGVRNFFATAEHRELDRQGRIAIPQSLRAFAGLERDVVISGQFDRIEIWDVGRWQQREESGDEVLVEGTVGAGGHARALLEARSDLRLVGLDRDGDAVDAATGALAGFADRVVVRRVRFDEITTTLQELGHDTGRRGDISGALFDL